MSSVEQPAWDPLWADDARIGDRWRTPSSEIMAWAETVWKAGGRRVLDLGCGIGRHVISLVQQGFEVTGCDVSTVGLARCRTWLTHEGLTATLARHPMTHLPYPDHSFDAVLAFFVIYHGTRADIQRTLSEVRRVLVPGGHFYATFIARDAELDAQFRADVAAGRCVEIEPYTFVAHSDAEGDKEIPHHYSDEAEVRALLDGFMIDELYLDRRERTNDQGNRKVHMHYHVQARKRSRDMEKHIGQVTHYFTRLGVAALKITGELQVGDVIHIQGHTTDFVQTVESMEIERQPVESVGPGTEVGLKVLDRVRKGDAVFKVVEEA